MDLEYGTITMSGDEGIDLMMFNNLFDFFNELNYTITLSRGCESITELKDNTNMPDVFIGEVTNCGNFLDIPTDETIEFRKNTYVQIETSVLDNDEIPIYLKQSEFDRILFQVYVRFGNIYHVKSQNLFPTREAAEACMKKIKNPYDGGN